LARPAASSLGRIRFRNSRTASVRSLDRRINRIFNSTWQWTRRVRMPQIVSYWQHKQMEELVTL
jgi:hypothetical protein